MGEHARLRSPGTGSPRWNTDIIHVINSAWALLALTSPNVQMIDDLPSAPVPKPQFVSAALVCAVCEHVQ